MITVDSCRPLGGWMMKGGFVGLLLAGGGAAAAAMGRCAVAVCAR